ncbi:hypothetical protein VOLCADRAFT_87820 [Volvox carteri f. nagariensis]|uniref:Uncharacterized protein n=1 Tax=Volvox carteri f. nagariensis TaxID=3068 RepID=D8TMC0_VOLCA|nr:uncharacterized protein VOLCADRAFT_87820 [Volvox carteri f. nagariensis]EFJ51617.1 hypothetical protein VOLCADRAFT_87820 [Volvox carteri f. nagariensis]|eukprot:XP_002947569.1 hypothetical protein VOLCADRAFT_87820 [Volvox carteri f. nagariensis]
MRDVTRFNPVCLIGNWAEDRELQRTILKDLLSRKGTGTLKLDAFRSRMSCALSEVALTRVADDPYLHLGDVVQLVHVDTGCVLAGDPADADSRPGEQACAATAAPDVRAPCCRNSLIILPYVPPKTATALEPPYTDNIVHYGQKQLVGFTARVDSYDCAWTVVTPDPGQRAASEGVEVAVGAPILLVHCATQKPLCLEAARYPNDYGIELEVSARSATANGLKLALEQLSQGVSKGFLPKGEQSDNCWTFVGGSKVAELPPAKSSADEAAAFLEGLVSELGARQGALSLLERKLVTLENNQQLMPAEDFKLVLRQVGSQLPEDGIAVLLTRYAPPGARVGASIDAGLFRNDLKAAATAAGLR